MRGPPVPEKGDAHQQRSNRRHDVNQSDLDVVRPHELNQRERAAADEQRRHHFHRSARSRHRPHQPHGKDQRERRQDAAGHGTQLGLGKTGHTGERSNGIADSAPRHGRCVGQQTQDGGFEGRKAQADQERARDGDWSSASAKAFEERTKAERDQHSLDASIVREVRDGSLHPIELSGFDRDLVQEDRGDDDPGNAKEAEHHTVQRGVAGQGNRHAEHGDRDGDGHDCACDGCDPDPLAQRHQHEEEGHDRQRRDGGREPLCVKRIVDLLPGHEQAAPYLAALSRVKRTRPAPELSADVRHLRRRYGHRTDLREFPRDRAVSKWNARCSSVRCQPQR